MGYPSILLNGISTNRTASSLCSLIKTWAILLSAYFFAHSVSAGYLEDAQQHFEKGDYKSAVIQLKNALQKNGNDAEARLLLGQSHLKMGKLNAAEKELGKAKDLGIDAQRLAIPMARTLLKKGQFDQVLSDLTPEDLNSAEDKSEALAILGHAYLAKKQLSEAKDSFSRALEASRTPYAILGSARVDVFEGRMEEGLAGVEEALALQANYTEAMFTKAQILIAQNKYQQVVQVFDAILEHEEHIAARMARAESYVRLNKLGQARADVDRILEQNAMYPQANFLLARLQIDAKQYEAAQVSAEKVLRILPAHQMSLFILGTTHYAQDNLEQAKLYLEKFLVKHSSQLNAVRLLGAIYMKLGDPASTVDLFMAVDEESKNSDAQLLNLLGRAYLQLGNFEKGTAALSRAVEIVPELEGARTQIALGQLALGNSDEAISQLEGAVEQAKEGDIPQVMLILAYIRESMFMKAEEAINNALKKQPRSGVYYNLKGMAYEAQLKKEEAEAAYNKALSVDADYVPAMLLLAKLKLKDGGVEEAKRYYQRVLELNSSNLQAQLAMAQIARSQGDEEDFLERLQKARDNNPRVFGPVALLANYFLQQRQLDKAFKEVNSFQTEQPKHIEAMSLLVSIHLAKGDKEQARYQLQKIIDINPRNVIHRMQLAQLLASDQQMQDALAQIAEVLTIDPEYLPGLAAKVSLEISEKRFGDANAGIEKISSLYPKSHMQQQLQGDLLLAQDDIEQAIEAYEKAFQQAKTPYILDKLVQLYSDNDEVEIATQRLQSYIDAVPQDNRNKLRLATAYQQLQQNDKAIVLYEQLYQLAPDNELVLNNLAWLYWVVEDSRSLEYARKAKQAAPERAEVIDTLGWIMLHKGDVKEALDTIQMAVSKAPTNPEIRYHLAVALNKNNQKNEARKELKRLLRDYGEFSGASNARKLLAELER